MTSDNGHGHRRAALGENSQPSPFRMVARGMVKRCALCGSGNLFERWFRMRDHCPGCGYRFEREEGFFLGAYVINLAVTEGLLLFLAFIPLILLLAANPDTGLLPVLIGGAVAAVIAPVLFYPFSRTIWLAIDLILRPWHASEPTDRI